MYLMSDEEPMPHKAKKDPKGCHRRKGMKHELEIIQANHYSFRNACGYSSYKITTGGTKKWYICRHQKSCKKCGKIVEWSLRDEKECPEWNSRNDTWWGRLKSLDLPDLDDLTKDL